MSELPTTASAIVSRKVKGVLAELDVTQTELGHRLGMAQKTVSKRITGETPWRVDDVVDVAQALDVPLERILPLDELTRRRAS